MRRTLTQKRPRWIVGRNAGMMQRRRFFSTHARAAAWIATQSDGAAGAFYLDWEPGAYGSRQYE